MMCMISRIMINDLKMYTIARKIILTRLNILTPTVLFNMHFAVVTDLHT